MIVTSKFDIGQRVWHPEITSSGGSKSIDVLSGTISSIAFEKDNKISYFFDEWGCDAYEEDIIAYEDTESLINKLIELDNKIREEKESK